MAIKTYHGSCHCGAVSYEADIDLQAGTGKCNCSICKKSRAWGTNIKPQAFRLLSGEDALSDYRFGTMQGRNRFCATCGVRTHGDGDVPEIGGPFVSINIATIDNITDEELAALPIGFANGRENDWMNAPKVTSYL